MDAALTSRHVAALLALAAALPAHGGDLPAGASDPHAQCKARAAEAAAATPGDASRVEVKVADAALVDQDGQPRRLLSDVIGDRLVVMSFVFTTCTTICPIVSTRLALLQRRLGGRLDAEVRLVSLSIDPRRDTPARLKAYAARHGAGPGWVHLTGRPDEVEQVLRGLGVYTPAPADHAPVTLVADGRTGRWTRLNGFPAPDRIIAQLDELAAARRLADAGRLAP